MFFKNKVAELVEKYVPLRQPDSGKKNAEWMTKETKKLIKDRNEAWTAVGEIIYVTKS